MLKLTDIMTTDVLTLRPDNTLRDAIELFSGNHISGAPVLDDGTLTGVLTAIDVMDAVAAEQRTPVTGGQAWIDDEDDLHDVEAETASYFMMSEYDEPDLGELGSAVTEGSDLLDRLTVADAMTRSIAELESDVEIHEAAQYMLQRGIHRVLVVNDGQLEGLVSTTDFLRAIAERRL
jgi:CBS domain-containing protein